MRECRAPRKLLFRIQCLQEDSIADLYAKSGAVVSMVGSAKDLLTFLQSAGTIRHF